MNKKSQITLYVSAVYLTVFCFLFLFLPSVAEKVLNNQLPDAALNMLYGQLTFTFAYVVFLAHPRSGSSSLYEILQSHPALNILEEPFNENFTRWNAGNKNYLELVHDIPSLDAQTADIFAEYNGIKVLDYQLPPDLIAHLLQCADCKIIFLRRRNLLQSVVSALIAEQTRLWKKWEMIKPLEEYYRNLQPLNIMDLQKRVAELKSRLDFFESVIDRRPADEATKLTYEEFYYSEPWRQEQRMSEIWGMLKLPPLKLERRHRDYLQPKTAKINSAVTYEMLPNAREIDKACGNDATGWLYDTHSRY